MRAACLVDSAPFASLLRGRLVLLQPLQLIFSETGLTYGTKSGTFGASLRYLK